MKCHSTNGNALTLLGILILQLGPSIQHNEDVDGIGGAHHSIFGLELNERQMILMIICIVLFALLIITIIFFCCIRRNNLDNRELCTHCFRRMQEAKRQRKETQLMNEIYNMIEANQEVDMQQVLQDPNLSFERRIELRQHLIDLLFKRMTLTNFADYKETFDDNQEKLTCRQSKNLNEDDPQLFQQGYNGSEEYILYQNSPQA